MAKMESVISLKTGDNAPEFNLKGIDDQMHSLNDYSKKGLLVIFMCNHCPFVKAKIEAIKELHDKFKDDISIVGINSNDSVKYPDDDFDSMKAVAKEKGLEIDYLVDETQEIAKKYGAVCTPDFFGYNKNLELQYRGRLRELKNFVPVKDGESDLLKAMRQIVEIGNGPQDQIPSAGCGIKWKYD